MEKHELAKLEGKIRDVANRLAGLSGKGDGQKEAAGAETGGMLGLLQIIHRPGWTTVAESIFVNGLLDAIVTHTQALSTLQQTLLAGSAAVNSGG